MRISFVVANYPPSVGGTQLLVQRIAEGLVKSYGHSVTVVTTDARLSPGGPDPGRLPAGDDSVNGVFVRRRPVARRAHSFVRGLRKTQVRLHAGRMLGSTDLIASGPIGLSLMRTVRQAAAGDDLVVGVGASFLTIPAVDLATRIGRARAVYLPLLHLSGPPPRPAALRALRSSVGVVSLTDFERDWLIDQGVAAHRVTSIPPGCAPAPRLHLSPSQAREELGLPDRLTVGYVGRLAPHKGIDTLLSVMERVWTRRSDVNLLLAGSRTSWGRFDEILARTGAVAGDRLQLREHFAEADKPVLFSACDVVASPSREESFGITTLESWSAGRAMVAGDIGAVRSLIRPGEDGELVAVDDVQAWASVLDGLLGDERRRQRLGSAGCMRVEHEFQWRSVVDRWNDLLEHAADTVVTSSEPAGSR